MIPWPSKQLASPSTHLSHSWEGDEGFYVVCSTVKLHSQNFSQSYSCGGRNYHGLMRAWLIRRSWLLEGLEIHPPLEHSQISCFARGLFTIRATLHLGSLTNSLCDRLWCFYEDASWAASYSRVETVQQVDRKVVEQCKNCVSDRDVTFIYNHHKFKAKVRILLQYLPRSLMPPLWLLNICFARKGAQRYLCTSWEGLKLWSLFAFKSPYSAILLVESHNNRLVHRVDHNFGIAVLRPLFFMLWWHTNLICLVRLD